MFSLDPLRNLPQPRFPRLIEEEMQQSLASLLLDLANHSSQSWEIERFNRRITYSFDSINMSLSRQAGKQERVNLALSDLDSRLALAFLQEKESLLQAIKDELRPRPE